MSNRIQVYKQGDRVKLSATGEVYEVLEHEDIFVKTRNLNTGYLRIFPLVEIVSQTCKLGIFNDFILSAEFSELAIEENKGTLKYENATKSSETPSVKTFTLDKLREKISFHFRGKRSNHLRDNA
ncbi:MAG: hypothetical protein QNJ54_14585 [Prochloraceae cyanobacterium]|nr:hypothetical protein [Prochloraceae cyanobacterium]